MATEIRENDLDLGGHETYDPAIPGTLPSDVARYLDHFDRVTNAAGLSAVDTTTFLVNKTRIAEVTGLVSFFYFAPASVATADGVTVIAPSVGSGRWLLLSSGQNGTALSVLGRSINSSGTRADIPATAASDAVLRESGSTIGWGTIATAGYSNNSVTYAKIQATSAASVLIGRGAGAGAGNVQELTLGSSLSFAGTVLSVASGVFAPDFSLTAGSVVYSAGTDVLAQNNANFFWDNPHVRLGLGTNTPSTSLQIRDGASNQFTLGSNAAANADYSIGRVTGGGDDGYLRFLSNYTLADQAGFLFTGVSGDRLRIAPITGIITAFGLSGTGSQLVLASATGLLSRAVAGTDYIKGPLTGDVTTVGNVATNVNAPTHFTFAGDVITTAIAAPASPAAGKATQYVDLTSLNFASKNASGVVNHGIQTRTATASQWIRSIADDGTTTISQPAFTDVSGTATYAQIQNGTALSVLGRSANSSGVLADIPATAASGAVLRESGSTIGWGTLATAAYGNNTVDNTKIAQMAAGTYKGNATGSTANAQDVAVPLINQVVFSNGTKLTGSAQLVYKQSTTGLQLVDRLNETFAAASITTGTVTMGVGNCTRFLMTGTISKVLSTNWQDGAFIRIWLIASGGDITVTHNAGGGDGIFLAHNATLTIKNGNGYLLSLSYSQTDTQWIETSGDPTLTNNTLWGRGDTGDGRPQQVNLASGLLFNTGTQNLLSYYVWTMQFGGFFSGLWYASLPNTIGQGVNDWAATTTLGYRAPEGGTILRVDWTSWANALAGTGNLVAKLLVNGSSVATLFTQAIGFLTDGTSTVTTTFNAADKIGIQLSQTGALSTGSNMDMRFTVAAL
jgi:hypothetical protein